MEYKQKYSGVARWQVSAGFDLVRVITEIEPTDGVSEFVVLGNELSRSDCHAPAATR